MELLNNYKKLYVRAGSLLESVIAITIITISILMALKLFIIVLDSKKAVNHHIIGYKIGELVTEMKFDQNYDSEIYEFENFWVEKKVSDYETQNNLLRISYIVMTRSDTLEHSSYLILRKDEN